MSYKFEAISNLNRVTLSGIFPAHFAIAEMPLEQLNYELFQK